MPRRPAFTFLCQQVARLADPPRADLHAHTTASDGDYTPSQLVALARVAKLSAVAVTDHDTLAGVPEAVRAAPAGLEVVPGVELSTAFDGRELHLLGYFVRLDHPGLNAALARLCDRRRERFRDYVAKLAVIPADRAQLIEERTPSLGRRHVANLLVACGFARDRHEAFYRFLHRLHREVVPKELLPIGEAIELVHAADGVASLAHPPADLLDGGLDRLAALGLDGLECEYAWGRASPAGRLRAAAARLGLVVTGGSDCHGPDPAHRHLGSVTVPLDTLASLRGKAVEQGERSNPVPGAPAPG